MANWYLKTELICHFERGPDDLQLSLRNGGAGATATSAGAAAAAYYANVMTADSEPKKAKLDPSLYSSQFYTPTMHHGLTTSGASAAVAAAAAAAANATTTQLLTGNPITQIQGIQLSTLPQCNTTSSATTTPVSKVVHVRNIPPDLVDLELMQLCIQYGPVSNYMMLKGKSQAFVEYEEETSAAAFVTSMTAVPIQIRGRTLFAQYSTHRELKFDKNKAVSDTEVSFFSDFCLNTKKHTKRPLSLVEIATFRRGKHSCDFEGCLHLNACVLFV
ncbi:hypothetical protein CRE_02201 [Caenorhabditis remanei]|uniref:RRM domain-containing protein n=1 Tax=Caenorhabditis remanei TaxID=31234 RepID=E3LFL7_CAERE|nr:hypothetical protein CRE_02201 [Caenorhabditis remanei]